MCCCPQYSLVAGLLGACSLYIGNSSAPTNKNRIGLLFVGDRTILIERSWADAQQIVAPERDHIASHPGTWMVFLAARRPVNSDVMSQSDPIDVEHEPWEVTFVRDQLHFAAQDGNVEEVQRLLAAGYQLSRFDEIGKTPLHYAAMGGHLNVMNVLLAAGADVNAHDERVIGNTVLGEVASNCSFEVAKILVDAGADPTIPGWMLLTALDKSQERKKPEGVRVHQLLEQAARRYRPSGT